MMERAIGEGDVISPPDSAPALMADERPDHTYPTGSPSSSQSGSLLEEAGQWGLGSAASPHRPTGDEWEPPVPLPSELAPVASLEPEMIPAPLRGWVMDVAERMQIPPDFVAAPAIVVASSIIGRQIGIHPKQLDDWLVVPNLWGAVVGRPSLLKSPAIAEAMRPLERLVRAAQERFETARREYAGFALIQDAKREALKKELAGAARKGDDGKLNQIQLRLLSMAETDAPTLRRYKTEDSTIEKIGELLLENPNGLLVHRDELSGWLRSLDKLGRECDRAFYLEAWSGAESFTVDRIGRGTVHIPALCLSVLGGIQPGPLSSYVYQATAGRTGDDGLLQRFQLLVWPDVPSGWRNVDRKPDTEAQARAHEVFALLDQLDPAALGAIPEREGAVPALRFAPDAQEAFDAWRTELETRLRQWARSAALEAHLGKYRSLVPSLALIFHLCGVIDGSYPPGPIGPEPTLTAIAWSRYLETHAERLYGASEAPEMESTRALLKRIRSGDLGSPFTPREIYRKHWTLLKTTEEVERAIEVLAAYGWVRAEKKPTKGRPSITVHVHPQLAGDRTRRLSDPEE